jgi:two-component sensor histidine kinase
MRVASSEVIDAFRESQDRIISMALIHEELYKSGKIQYLDLSSYREKLTQNLVQTYRFVNTNILLNTDLEENLFFDIDTTIPLGMIVNELTSNSLKHAFPGRADGKIQIKFCREKIGEYISRGGKSKIKNDNSTSFTLAVSDNGVGIPENLEIEETESLGFQVVASLIDQLNGELELKRNKGTEFTMRFTVEEKTSIN